MKEKRPEIAILPLEDVVLYPHMVLPMHIYDDNYIELVDFAMKGSKKVAMTLKTPEFEKDPQKETFCCLSEITFSDDELLEEEEGRAIVVSGKSRATIENIIQREPFITATFQVVGDECSSQTAFDQYREQLPKKLMRYLFLKNLPYQDIHIANLIVDPGHIADFVAYYIVEDIYIKMKLLETADVCERCKITDAILDQLLTKQNPD